MRFRKFEYYSQFEANLMAEEGDYTNTVPSAPEADGAAGALTTSTQKEEENKEFGLCYYCLEKPGHHRCSKCHIVSYCSPECQRNDWKKNGHKACCALLCFPDAKVAKMKEGCLQEEGNEASYTPYLCMQNVWDRGRIFYNKRQFRQCQECCQLALSLFQRYHRPHILHVDVVSMAELHRDVAQSLCHQHPLGSLCSDTYVSAQRAFTLAEQHFAEHGRYISLLLPYLDPPQEGVPHFHSGLPMDDRIQLIDRIEDCGAEALDLEAEVAGSQRFIALMLGTAR
mgnify:CR=1 FL=1